MGKGMELMGIPILIAVICIVYGLRLIITRDSSCIRSKDSVVPKDDRTYSLYAGLLMLGFAVASMLMGVLLITVGKEAALIEMVVSVIAVLIAYSELGKRSGMK